MEAPVWFITGAASGFGHEIAVEALRRGGRVVATARDPSKIAISGENVLTLPLDVRDRDAIAAAVRAAEARFGSVDVLVNNAGYGLIAAVEEATQDEIDALIGTHFTGTLDLIRAVLPGMRSRRRGYILNFSSIAGFTGGAGTALYAAAKHGVEGLSEGLAKEVAPLGIKVSIVEPGPFQTQFFTSSRKMGERRMPDYDATAGAYRDRASKPDPWLPGDPARGAAAVCDLVEMAEPPMRLLLGKFAHDIALASYSARIAEAERFRDLTLGADKPEAEGRPWP
ncbi:SDR family NAD(P)-dependent oxidoreductase [Sphingomonas sp. AOB5]|uniref:SDR family NAD(P)-dependent oxidoreductase n=1 Tax=Sphingomonas sp. AOB5 TaxID=3034017 RepID=UPI0023F76BA9|nr:SDR family NAD(P)-dependent oxidoreductase [Sphingomonas sp. AOB5]MDF7776715.1 SDR family NAD(P)-dependent oxidoreductase [Sphingomonas sp. AOB5]